MHDEVEANRESILNIIRQSGYGPMMSTADVATFVGLSMGAIHKALVAGRLQGVRLGGPRGRWRVPARSLAEFVCGRSR